MPIVEVKLAGLYEEGEMGDCGRLKVTWMTAHATGKLAQHQAANKRPAHHPSIPAPPSANVRAVPSNRLVYRNNWKRHMSISEPQKGISRSDQYVGVGTVTASTWQYY